MVQQTSRDILPAFHEVIRQHILSAVFLIAALFGIYLISLYDYLLFHSLAEVFSIVISYGIFMIAWNARRLLQSNYLLFIGIAYFYVGGIDLLHTLAYEGMGVFDDYGANLSTQLWIIGRYIEAISLLIAPGFIHRKLSPRPVFTAYGLLAGFLMAAVFYWKVFPDCFIEGAGLTPFKIYSEYLICLIFVAAIGLLIRHSKDFDRRVLILLVASMAVSVVKELSFTSYVSVYGPSNMIGHLLKIISCYLIYKAIIETGIVTPWNLLFRDLKRSEAKYRSMAEELRRSESRFRLLSETASRLLKTDNTQGIVSSICRDVMAHLDCHACFNFLADEQAGRLHLNVCAGIPEKEVRKIEWLDYGVAVCGCVARDGEPIIAEDIFRIPDVRTERVKSYGIQAYACHPILSQGRLIGTLSFGTKTRTSFSPEEIDLMRTVTDQVAVAMERIRLIEELKRARDDLEIRVQERTAELAEANTALLESERKFRRIAETLERANQDLADFNHIAAHDLLEPLRLLVTLGDRLAYECGQCPGQDGRHLIERIQQSARRASTLIRDIHKYSMASSLDANFIQTDLNELIRDILVEFEPSLEQNKAIVELEDLLTLEVDPSHLGDVFRNLLSNALKFTGSEKPGIRIFGETTNDGKWYRIFVKDNGIGFNESYLDKIFIPFQKLHHSSRFEGSGIGLALCRKVLERHGGGITATSKPGQGSTFIITLPLSRPGLKGSV